MRMTQSPSFEVKSGGSVEGGWDTDSRWQRDQL